MKDFVLQMKDEENWIRSQENRDFCQPFEVIKSELVEICKKYKTQGKELKKHYKDRVSYWQYSSGDFGMHRGFHCPNPVEDLVVGNIKRGKILKRITSQSNPTYRYGYDADNQLIIANDLHLPHCIEIIIIDNNSEIGVTFDTRDVLCAISLCKFKNGKLISYAYSLCDSNCNINQFIYDCFEYSEGFLSRNDHYEYLLHKKTVRVDHVRYDFVHDSEGFLLKYTTTYYRGNNKIPSIMDGKYYPIKGKHII